MQPTPLWTGWLALLACLAVFAVAGAGPNPSPAPVQAAEPGDWPMYAHDPQHTSANPDETTITRANVDQLVPRWQARLESGPNPAFSTPSMSGGLVYVGSSVLTGTNFFAFDAATGGRTWDAFLGRTNDCFNVGLGSTAAISGTLLVTGGGDGAYYALDARTGAQLWRYPLGVGATGFAWESPLLAYGRAYLGVASGCDAPQVRGEMRAVDLQTGQQIVNQYFVPEGQVGASIWQSPALSADGGTLAITTGEDRGKGQFYARAMVTLDPLSLAIGHAHQEGTPNSDMDFATSPVIFHDVRGRALVGAVHKNGILYAYALNDVGAGAVWQRDVGGMVGLLPAYDPAAGEGGTVFAVGDRVHALDPTTGAERWVSPGLGLPWSNLAIANGLIFVNTGGAVFVLDESNGQIVRSLVPAYPGPTYSGVIVAHGFVYWVSGCYLNAWSLPGPPPPPTPTPATPPPTPATCDIHFLDVCGCDYFYEPVHYLFCAGAVAGYGDGTFHPYNSTTRGQMVKIVVNAFHIPAYTPPTPTFADVPAMHPFFTYIEAAVHAGMVSGYGDGTFQPSADVTRAQLTKIIVNAAGGPLVAPADPTFADVPSGSAFAPYIETAVCRGLLSGYGCGGSGEPCDPQQRPYFRPANSATRGQIAKIAYHALTNPPACPSPTPGP